MTEHCPDQASPAACSHTGTLGLDCLRCGSWPTMPATSGPTPPAPPATAEVPPEVIAIAVRWYLRYGRSYRDVEEPPAERGITVDHVTVYRWCSGSPRCSSTPHACPLRHVAGDRWSVDETCVNVAGRWRYLSRAVDQFGQVIDVLLSEQRDADVPAHPPHLTADQALKTAKAEVQGDPAFFGIRHRGRPRDSREHPPCRTAPRDRVRRRSRTPFRLGSPLST